MPLARSEIMARIRSRDTSPELALRSALHLRGLRFRVHRMVEGVGRIDIAFVGLKVAIQVDGCFWHGCPLHGSSPKTNKDFWDRKLARNRERDAEQTMELGRLGWKVLRFWEHEVYGDLRGVVAKVMRTVASRRRTVQPCRGRN